jgi:hypothetical protein
LSFGTNFTVMIVASAGLSRHLLSRQTKRQPWTKHDVVANVGTVRVMRDVPMPGIVGLLESDHRG